MRTVLVTHVTQYAGPGVADTLCRQGFRVFAHDTSFGDPGALAEFAACCPAIECLRAVEPDALAAELCARGVELEALVCNDVYPNTPRPIEAIDLDDLRRSFEALFVFPLRLTQALLPGLRARGGGSLVYITSARPLRPEHGFAVPTSIRAATTTFALALAREVAKDGIQVNVVAPNYLYSELYYPRARFVDDLQGREQIAAVVPMGRLGTPEEIGELVAFLASGRAAFVTGQVLYFTGGWP